MFDVILILIGALCAIAGGFLSTWFAAKKARKIRFEETMGEKMVQICSEALPKISRVIGDVVQDTLGNTLIYVEGELEWIMRNRAFLPSEFFDYWHTIRLDLRKVVRRETHPKAIDTPQEKERLKELDELEKQIKACAREAENTLFKELNLTPFKRQNLK